MIILSAVSGSQEELPGEALPRASVPFTLEVRDLALNTEKAGQGYNSLVGSWEIFGVGRYVSCTGSGTLLYTAQRHHLWLGTKTFGQENDSQIIRLP